MSGFLVVHYWPIILHLIELSQLQIISCSITGPLWHQQGQKKAAALTEMYNGANKSHKHIPPPFLSHNG